MSILWCIKLLLGIKKYFSYIYIKSDLHLTKEEHYRIRLYKEVWFPIHQCYNPTTNDITKSSDSNRDLLVVSNEELYICSCPTRKQVPWCGYYALLMAVSRILARSHKVDDRVVFILIRKFRDTCSFVKEEFLVPTHSHWWVQS